MGAAELDMYVSEARQGHFTTAPAECKQSALDAGYDF